MTAETLQRLERAVQAERRAIPWLLLLTWLALAGGLVVVFRSRLMSDSMAPWSGVGSAVLLASAALFVGYGLNHLGWGLATALVLTIHPFYGTAVKADATCLLDEGLELVTF